MAALLCVAVLAQGNRAQAWTKARVQGVGAELELHPDGRADVLLKIELNILGGFLSELAIEGLDPDLALDPGRPPSLTSEQGRLYVPQVKVQEGKPLLLYFPHRRAAPWRGVYLVEVAYGTRLVPRSSQDTGKGALRVSWTLPAWEAGLENVQIRVKAPPGTRPVALAEERAHAIEVGFQDGRGATSINWRRIRLPQTESWTVAFDVPRWRIGAALPPPTVVAEPRVRQGGGVDRTGFWLAGTLMLLALFKRESVKRACARASVEPVLLVPLGSEAAGYPVMIALALTAGLLFRERTGLSLAAMGALVGLGLLAAFRPGRAPGGGAWSPAGRTEVKAGRRDRLHSWFGAPAWMDATTPLGATVLASAYLLLGVMLWQKGGGESRLWALGTLLSTPLFISGTRLQLPPSPAEALLRLRRAAERSGLNRALKPVGKFEALVFRGARGRVYQSRLRLRTDHPLSGLLRLELVSAKLFWPGAGRGKAALLVTTLPGSEADSAMGGALPRARVLAHPTANSKAYVAPLDEGRHEMADLLAGLLGTGVAGEAVSRRAA